MNCDRKKQKIHKHGVYLELGRGARGVLVIFSLWVRCALGIPDDDNHGVGDGGNDDDDDNGDDDDASDGESEHLMGVQLTM